MTILIDLLKVNVAFYEFLSKGIPEDEHDADSYIEKINAFLDKRENILSNVTVPETEEEIRIAKTIIDYHKKIDTILHENSLMLKKEIRLLNQKKVQNKSYDNPYNQAYNDGIFFDRKK